MQAKPQKAKYFALSKYVEAALKQAEYEKDENRVVIGKVPEASGFFAQGDTFEEARANLQDVIEGHVILALQLGLEIPNPAGPGTKQGVEKQKLIFNAEAQSFLSLRTLR